MSRKPTYRPSLRTIRIVQRHLDHRARIEHCNQNTESFALSAKEGEIPGSLTSTEWFTTEQAARYLGLSEAALRNMTSNGQVPYYKLGRRNRYRVPELRELLLSRKRGGIHGL
jgi:excisionase family DNA binding protein